jgi:hypothetical protein
MTLPRLPRASPPALRRRAATRRIAGLAGLGMALLGARASRASADQSAVLRVGPSQALQTLAAAARVAKPGATIAVDAGEYRGDVAVWSHDRLTLRAVGGRVRLVADGAAAEAKAIWVVRAAGVVVDGFDFEGAAVDGRNGAGIRLESGSLKVRDCRFIGSEMGLMTGNDGATELDVEGCEFGHATPHGARSHLLYAGAIRRLAVTGSSFHHGREGHLLKSRAAFNRIAYNRLADGADGRASYELEFPDGGVAIVVGNVIGQGPLTENPQLVSYAAEGWRWPDNTLALVHNTLVDERTPAGTFVSVRRGSVAVTIVNNLLVGAAQFDLPAGARLLNNRSVDRAELGAADAANDAWRPKPRTAAAAPSATLASVAVGAEALLPDREFSAPRGSVALGRPAVVPGALQPAARAAR